MLRHLVVGLLLISGTVEAQLGTNGVRNGRMLRQELSVAGIRIGMSPADVEGAMRSRGYSLSRRAMGRSWESLISWRLQSTRPGFRAVDGTVVDLEFYVKGDEEVQVSYVPAPDGAEVSEVAYQIAEAAITPERFSASVVERYGRPARTEDSVSLYCSAGEPRCAFDDGTELPTLVAYWGWQGRRLVLHQGNRAMRAQEERIGSELLRRAPPARRTTF